MGVWKKVDDRTHFKKMALIIKYISRSGNYLVVLYIYKVNLLSHLTSIGTGNMCIV